MLIIGAGPTGICTLLSVMLKHPKRIIVCEKDEERIRFIQEHYPKIQTVLPEECVNYVREHSEHGGADAVSYTHLVMIKMLLPELIKNPESFQNLMQIAEIANKSKK